MGEKPQSFIVHKPLSTARSPIIFDNPHSGRGLPDHFNYSCDHKKLMAFGDLHIEKLLRDVPTAGVPVLEAKVHRAVIDLNRQPDEIDPSEVKGGWRAPSHKTKYTQDGFGLVPRRLGVPHRMTPIFNEASRPDASEIKRRLNDYYAPYHNALADLMDKAIDNHGVAIHMDIHSYRRRMGKNGMMPDFIIGNLHGQSCDPAITDFVADFFCKEGMSVAFNNPFKGAAIVSIHGTPEEQRHSLQIEIARDLYMNMETLEFDPAKGRKIQGLMTKLATELNRFGLRYAARLNRSSSPNTSPQASTRAASNSRKPT